MFEYTNDNMVEEGRGTMKDGTIASGMGHRVALVAPALLMLPRGAGAQYPRDQMRVWGEYVRVAGIEPQ